MDALGRNAVHVMTQAFSLSNFNAFQTLHHNQGWRAKLGMDDWDVYIGPFAEISLKSLQMCDLVSKFSSRVIDFSNSPTMDTGSNARASADHPQLTRDPIKKM